MSRYQQVKEVNGFLKDTVTGAIINSNSRDLKAYKQRKMVAASQKNQLNELSGDVNQLKEEMTEIKNMLALLLNK